MGGRLADYVHNWRVITGDAFIISVVTHGFLISPTPDFPGVLREYTVYPRKVSAQVLLEEEISSLLLKRAIVKVDDSLDLCLSPIFVVPKRSGGLRVILNLKKINCFLPPQHFRMETLSVLLPQLLREDWAVTIDLQDAYLHVPIHQPSRRLLGFCLPGVCYQYQVLPFGLRDSPWVFSRLVAAVVAFLRQKGIRILYYLDDWLLVAKSRILLESQLQVTLLVSRALEFLINLEKSSLTPTQLPPYLGAVLDIPNLLARPMDHRILSLQSLIQEFLRFPFATVELWQKFLGRLASFTDLIPQCRLLMRPLQLHFLKSSSPRTVRPLFQIPLPPHVRGLFQIWGSLSFLLQGKPFTPPPHSSADHFDGRVSLRVGCLSPSSSSVGKVVRSGGTIPYQRARVEGSVSRSSGLRESGFESSSVDSIGQFHSRRLYQPSGRDSFCGSVLEHSRTSGLVSGERDSPHSGAYPGRGKSRGGFLVQRELPSPLRMDLEEVSLSSDLPQVSVSGDRSLCLGPNLSAPEVLLEDTGSGSLGVGRPFLSVGRSQTLCLLLTVWPISGNLVKRQVFLRELPTLQPGLSGPQLEFLTIQISHCFLSQGLSGWYYSL